MESKPIKRRHFLESSAYIAGLATFHPSTIFTSQTSDMSTIEETSLLGAYGRWAADLVAADEPPLFSFRKDTYSEVRTWKSLARRIAADRLAAPDIIGTPQVTIERQYQYDDLGHRRTLLVIALWACNEGYHDQAHWSQRAATWYTRPT